MCSSLQAMGSVVALATGLALPAHSIRAEVKLPPVLSSHMVLQRDHGRADLGHRRTRREGDGPVPRPDQDHARPARTANGPSSSMPSRPADRTS